MQLTPVRAFALGVVSVLVIAGTFVAGIGVGARNFASEAAPAGEQAIPIGCPQEPDFTATRAATDRATECEVAQRVQDLLLRSGAREAIVQARLVESDSLLGPERDLDVVAEVRLPEGRRASWDAQGVRAMIARDIGTPIHRVMLVDEQLRPLVSSTPTATATPGPVALPGAIAAPASGIAPAYAARPRPAR